MARVNRDGTTNDFIDGWEVRQAGCGGGEVTMNAIQNIKMFEEGPERVTLGYRVCAWAGIEGGVDKQYYSHSLANAEYERLVKIWRQQNKEKKGAA